MFFFEITRIIYIKSIHNRLDPLKLTNNIEQSLQIK